MSYGYFFKIRSWGCESLSNSWASRWNRETWQVCWPTDLAVLGSIPLSKYFSGPKLGSIAQSFSLPPAYNPNMTEIFCKSSINHEILGKLKYLPILSDLQYLVGVYVHLQNRRYVFNHIQIIRNFAIIWVLPFLNNSKDLDQSYKMDLDFLDCLEGEKLFLITKEIWCHWFLLQVVFAFSDFLL